MGYAEGYWKYCSPVSEDMECQCSDLGIEDAHNHMGDVSMTFSDRSGRLLTGHENISPLVTPSNVALHECSAASVPPEVDERRALGEGSRRQRQRRAERTSYRLPAKSKVTELRPRGR